MVSSFMHPQTSLWGSRLDELLWGGIPIKKLEAQSEMKQDSSMDFNHHSLREPRHTSMTPTKHEHSSYGMLATKFFNAVTAHPIHGTQQPVFKALPRMRHWLVLVGVVPETLRLVKPLHSSLGVWPTNLPRDTETLPKLLSINEASFRS